MGVLLTVSKPFRRSFVVLTLGFICSFRIKAFHELFLMLGLNMAIILYNHDLVAPDCISEAVNIIG